MFSFQDKTLMPGPDKALAGREERMQVPERHYVNGNPMVAPFPDGLEVAMLEVFSLNFHSCPDFTGLHTHAI